MLDLRRRQFLTLLGGSAAAWPVPAQGAAAPSGAADRHSLLVAADEVIE